MTRAMHLVILPLCLAAAAAAADGAATKKAAGAGTPDLMSAATFAGLELRNIGPAFNSGRVVDVAVDPADHARFFVAAASGGVWRTDNDGITWTPVFDHQGSYSIGCVTLDPRDPDVIWVGTGENNSQRSVSFGDGVYLSRDGGTSWTNTGLKASEHIGRIIVDPRDSDVVYVAAQGPLWNPGGDRGLYRTEDGGATWKKVLDISENTGVTEVLQDPRDPDVLLAASYQRRRHVWTLIDGGPESAIYKSTDGGDTWRKVSQGLPKVDLGRIGMVRSPADPAVIYAIIEAADDKGGVFRSADGGESWEKRSKYMSTSPQYYNELVADPHDVDRVYSLDTFMKVSEDGGATWKNVGEKHKHVDNHALWIDPDDTDHLIAGCDGGVYETYDRGANWEFKANLPITQFYRVTVDTSKPFYYVYGGTQDNNTLGGPSRTLNESGISNEDWFVTVGGDGFETQVDPVNPDIVYSQYQHGGLVRYDRASGEAVDIQPQAAPGEEPLRWNWDSPLIVSPHSPSRLYFGAQRIFRSDDRGDTWTPISGDLTRKLDRDQLPVMGKIWSIDAVAKNASTSFYGNLVSLSESPVVEGLLYAGTDDGLVQITEDGGASWRTVEAESIRGVPERAYVADLEASRTDGDTVYAAFDNHKMGDFTPYLYRSTDRGRTWTSIAGDLPARHIVYTVAEDGDNPKLLFAGTEFGVFFTVDGGTRWIELTGGMPTIAVRDIDIQREHDDLALATFGRGFYILDDYTPLRRASRELLQRDAILFAPRDALLYVQKQSRIGDRGASFYAAPNPPFGAVFTYHLAEGLKTREEKRMEAETTAIKEGRNPILPSHEELRAEAAEQEPAVILTVADGDGNVVRRVEGPRGKGFHRVAWDLRQPAMVPISLKPREDLPPWVTPPTGPLVAPGAYTVTLAKEVGGTVTPLAEPQTFHVVPLSLATMAATDRTAVLAFEDEVADLQRAVRGAVEVAANTRERLDYVDKAIVDTPGVDLDLLATARELRRRLEAIRTELVGDRALAERNIPVPPSILERVERIVESQWHTTQAPTQTARDGYRYAGEAFAAQLAALRQLVQTDLPALEHQLELGGAPWTPGRLPDWTMK